MRDAATKNVERARPHANGGVVLRVVGASASPNPFVLRSGTATIGAGSRADLIIESESVSRLHVELTATPEGVVVRDLDSRNGTFYQGQRIGTLTLVPGARIVVGSVDVHLLPDLAAVEESPSSSYRGLLGTSQAMRRLFGVLSRLESSLANVLVLGESGVGKELVARALHEGSTLRDGPLVVVNCGTMSRELVVSELFGHKRGAFTGAIESRTGAFEAANGGTLFLDEIGELPLDVQPMLLRALESGEVVPVGETRPRKVRVRVVAATNRDLQEQMATGAFREDLYYRLAVVTLSVPPLRERPEDIEILARHAAKLAGLADLPDEVIGELRHRAFAGNVRELKNAVTFYAALGALPEPSKSKGDLLGIGVRSQIRFDQPFAQLRDTIEARFTGEYLRELMDRAGNNQSEASRVSGIERSQLRKLLGKYGLLGSR